jgi:2,3-bisphosphoglycerate-dependent phosphoglycerate mutase
MRIWLVRHGESLGNVDEAAWSKIPDHMIPLTEFGTDQARNAGQKIREYYESNDQLKNKKVRLWYSPFLRTQQTRDGVAKGLDDLVANHDHQGKPGWEDDRLREQDFGMFSPIYSKEDQMKNFPLEAEHFYNTRDHNGRYWAKAPLGESRADVCLRVGDFIDSIMRDAKEGVEDIVVVTHGVTMRAFEKRFTHRSVEWFEKEPNPHNCDVVLIETNPEYVKGQGQEKYKVSKMFDGIKRANSVPEDYKNTPVGGVDALKQSFGYTSPVQGRGA